jgi:molecular chaperone DnaK (HSP70)
VGRYSGVAWALSTSPADIDIISSWDSDLPANSDNHKVPSVLTYDSKRNVNSWGYKLERRRHHISWFKLLLSKHATDKVTEEQPDRIQKLQQLLSDYNKEPVDVAADYLRELWKHTSDEISRRVPALWENAELKITLTVPAIWDLSAQELTKKAAEMAGLLDRKGTTLQLIGEPEAAALSVFQEMSAQKWQKLKPGDAFVVCDSGGGTVVGSRFPDFTPY